MISKLMAGTLVVVLWTTPAAADNDPDATAGTTTGGLFATGTKKEGPAPGSKASQGGSDASPHITIGQAACPGATHIANTDAAVFCNPEQSQPALTLADIQKAFAELKLPASTLIIQPPDGLTLVNFATNFYTTNTTPITTTVTLLNQPVTLEATPTGLLHG